MEYDKQEIFNKLNDKAMDYLDAIPQEPKLETKESNDDEETV